MRLDFSVFVKRNTNKKPCLLSIYLKPYFLQKINFPKTRFHKRHNEDENLENLHETFLVKLALTQFFS